MEYYYVIGLAINFVIAFLIIIYIIIKNSNLDTNNVNLLVIGTIGFIITSFLGTFIFGVGMIAIIISSVSNFLKGNKS